MTRNIQEAIKIVMELMVFGVVVLLVSLSVNLSSTVNNRRLSNENLTVELQKQSMLYSYDSGYVYDINGVVTEPRVYMSGDDIMILANKYAKELDIRVQKNCDNGCSCLIGNKESLDGSCICSTYNGGCSVCYDTPTNCSCVILNPNSPEELWDLNNLRNRLGSSIGDTFIPVLNKDINGVVKGVIFYSKNKQLL